MASVEFYPPVLDVMNKNNVSLQDIPFEKNHLRVSFSLSRPGGHAEMVSVKDSHHGTGIGTEINYLEMAGRLARLCALTVDARNNDSIANVVMFINFRNITRRDPNSVHCIDLTKFSNMSIDRFNLMLYTLVSSDSILYTNRYGIPGTHHPVIVPTTISVVDNGAMAQLVAAGAGFFNNTIVIQTLAKEMLNDIFPTVTGMTDLSVPNLYYSVGLKMLSMFRIMLVPFGGGAQWDFFLEYGPTVDEDATPSLLMLSKTFHREVSGNRSLHHDWNAVAIMGSTLIALEKYRFANNISFEIHRNIVAKEKEGVDKVRNSLFTNALISSHGKHGGVVYFPGSIDAFSYPKTIPTDVEISVSNDVLITFNPHSSSNRRRIFFNLISAILGPNLTVIVGNQQYVVTYTPRALGVFQMSLNCFRRVINPFSSIRFSSEIVQVRFTVTDLFRLYPNFASRYYTSTKEYNFNLSHSAFHKKIADEFLSYTNLSVAVADSKEEKIDLA
jgi:hypothetical protein